MIDPVAVVRVRALVCTSPERFSVEDVPRPEPGRFEVPLPGEGGGDLRHRPSHHRRRHPGFWPKEFPFIPGHEWMGEVVEPVRGASDLGWQTGTRGGHLARGLRLLPAVRGGALQPL